MRTIWQFLTDFGDTAVTVPVAILVAGLLAAAGQLRLAIGWVLVIVGVAGATAGLKLAFTVCGYPFGGPDFTSPSGHTAMSIAVYGGFAAVAGFSLGARARSALFTATAVLTIGIAISRTVAGYHSPLEVLIGLAIGCIAMAAMTALVARYRPRQLPFGWLATGALVVFVLFHGTRWPAERAIHRLASWLDMLRPLCG